MAKNELLPFADGEDANVLPTAQWEALTDILENGFQSGIARSEQVNRVLAQGAVASYVLGQLIVDQLNKDATLDKDTLYQNLISALQENAKDACLPLSGGTMTGAVGFSGGEVTSYRVNLNEKNITCGGQTWENGASLDLRGMNCGSEGGWFTLLANNGSQYAGLIGKPDGTLTWGGLNVERVNTKGWNYICYQNGLMICWADVTTSSNGGVHWVFPVPFTSTNYGISAIIYGEANRNWSVLHTSPSTTGVNIWVKDNGSASGGANQTVRVTAFGYWM